MIRIGMLPVPDAERLKTRLATLGIAIETAFNHQTCKTGCSPSLEIWSHEDDAPKIAQLLDEERKRLIVAEGGDPNIVDQVFDTNQATAVCPACGTSFSTSKRECPDCGLAFALPEG